MNTKLLNRYTIQHEIAKGTHGILYRAHDKQSRKDVVIKVLNPGLKDPELFYIALREEIAPLTNIQHENITQYLDFQRLGDECILVLDYVNGRSIKSVMSNYPEGFPLSEVLRIVGSLADGLDHLRGQGLVHQDVTPDNVLLEVGTGRPVLIDHHLNTLVAIDATPMSAAYMSPEQCAEKDIDPSTDLYALGIMTFEMLTGQRPFIGESPETAELPSTIQRVQWEHLNAPVPRISEKNPALPKALDAVFNTVLAKTPKGRYKTAHEFMTKLKDTLAKSNLDLSESSLIIEPPTYQRPPSKTPALLRRLLGYGVSAAVLAGLIYLGSIYLTPVVNTVIEDINAPTATRRPVVTMVGETPGIEVTVPMESVVTEVNAATATPPPTRFPSLTPRPTTVEEGMLEGSAVAPTVSIPTNTPTPFPSITPRPSNTPGIAQQQETSVSATLAFATATNTPTPFPTVTPRGSVNGTLPAPITAATDVTAVVLGEVPANVRNGPTLDAPVMEVVFPSEQVRVAARDESGQWLLIRLANGGTGWVNAALLSLSNTQILALPVER
jgi:serine/threonine protein kinase